MEHKSFVDNGITYHELYVPCEVCAEMGKNTFPRYWMHGNNDCRGNLYIGENCMVYYEKCRAKFPITKARYGRPGHLHSQDDLITECTCDCWINQIPFRSGGFGMLSIVELPWLEKFWDNLGDLINANDK